MIKKELPIGIKHQLEEIVERLPDEFNVMSFKIDYSNLKILTEIFDDKSYDVERYKEILTQYAPRFYEYEA